MGVPVGVIQVGPVPVSSSRGSKRELQELD